MQRKFVAPMSAVGLSLLISRRFCDCGTHPPVSARCAVLHVPKVRRIRFEFGSPIANAACVYWSTVGA